MLVISLFVAVSLLSGLSGQKGYHGPYGRTFNSTCSSFGVSEVKPLNQKLIYGIWYLYAAFDHGLPINNYNCIVFIHYRDDHRRISTEEQGVHLDSGSRYYKRSRLVFENPHEGRYTYKAGDIFLEIQIIDTDHSTYYIEYHCKDESKKSICYVGVFTKLPEPDDDTRKKIKKFLTKHKLAPESLRYIKQSSSACD